LQMLEDNPPVKMGNEKKVENENADGEKKNEPQIGTNGIAGTAVPQQAVENSLQGGNAGAGGNTPPIQATQQANKEGTTQNEKQGNYVHSSQTQTTKEPTISTTKTYTDYDKAKSFEDWSKMQGNEPWEEYARMLGIQKPEAPELDEKKERRLASYALINSLGQGLATLAEAHGLSEGSSVRVRDIQPSALLQELKELQKQHQDDVSKHPKLLENYYKSVQDYEMARRKRYLEDREKQGVKTSVTETMGGGSTTDKYDNWGIEEQRHKWRMQERRTGGSSGTSKGTGNGKEQGWSTYPIGNTGQTYSYSYGNADKLKSSANYAREGLLSMRIPGDIEKRILNTLKGQNDYGGRAKKDLLGSRANWQDADNAPFMKEVVSGLLEYSERLMSDIQEMQKAGFSMEKINASEHKKWLDEVNDILVGIKQSGFEIKFE